MKDVPTPRFDGIRSGDANDIHDAIFNLWKAVRAIDPDEVSRKRTQLLENKTLDQVGIVDSTTEPDTESGVARLWVDSTTGDLYVKFGDGTKQLLAPDDGAGLVSAVTGTRVHLYSADAFGRYKMAQPYTIFDSKLLFDKNALLWDESITNTSGNATSTHSTANASVAMYVEAQDTIIRQTFQRFSYQPGKSQEVVLTGILGAGGTGTKSRIGIFDADCGLFFELDNATVNVVYRKGASDIQVPQSSWNVDKMNGSGVSGRTFNKAMANVFFIDFEWLGVGKVRWGIYVDGVPVVCHQIDFSNTVTSVYMATPNLPVRYEVSSAAGGASTTMTHICSAVISGGGQEATGKVLSAALSDSAAPADCNAIGTRYAVAGIRLKSTHLDAAVELLGFELLELAKTASWGWELMLNPTLANALTWTGVTNSAVEYATPDTGNDPIDETYSSAGTIIAKGFVGSGQRLVSQDVRNLIRLGSSIAGTPDTLILLVQPHAVNLDFLASMQWRESP